MYFCPVDQSCRIWARVCVCWFVGTVSDSVSSGGNVSLEVSNDGPTLIGAKATFTIQLRFPGNQTVLPDGQVVWAQNCTVNGENETNCMTDHHHSFNKIIALNQKIFLT